MGTGKGTAIKDKHYATDLAMTHTVAVCLPYNHVFHQLSGYTSSFSQLSCAESTMSEYNNCAASRESHVGSVVRVR